MQQQHEDRKKVWVDRFQTRLTIRISAYLGVSVAVLVNCLFAWRLLTEGLDDPGATFVGVLRDYAPVIGCLLVLLPVMVWDAVRFTHRLVGPMVRFRRAMLDIAEGQPVRPIKLREGDYLTELRDDFNGMLEALQRRGAAVLKPGVPAEDPPPAAAPQERTA